MDDDNFVGNMSGLFFPVRIVPDPDGKKNVADEIINRKKSLWEYRTIKESATKGSIPWIPANFTAVSQMAIWKAAISARQGSATPIEALGFITCKGRTFVCDPISFRIIMY